jgi:hypothetical protein
VFDRAERHLSSWWLEMPGQAGSDTRIIEDEAPYTFAPQPYGDLFVMKNDGTEVEQGP